VTQTLLRPTLAPAPPAHRRTQIWGLAGAFAVGMLVAVQSRVNGELGHQLGDGIAAALISFLTGLALLLAAAALLPRVRAGLGRVTRAVRHSDGLRWHQCLGGLAGAFLVACQSVTVTILGVAVFTVAVVGGQALSSLLVDRIGFGPAGPQPLSTLRVVGAVAALAAVVLAVGDRFGHASGLALAVLPALGGLGTAVQQAINGRVARTASPDPYGAVAAAIVNFSIGTAALVIVFAVDVALRGLPRALPTDPWLYVGGACGVAFISLAAAFVRVVGVFVLGLGTIAGQLVGSLVLDLTVPAAEHPVTVPVVAGTTLALVAVVMAALPGLRRA
jgi:bacterial/archaeal transporter family-2 protein